MINLSSPSRMTANCWTRRRRCSSPGGAAGSGTHLIVEKRLKIWMIMNIEQCKILIFSKSKRTTLHYNVFIFYKLTLILLVIIKVGRYILSIKVFLNDKIYLTLIMFTLILWEGLCSLCFGFHHGSLADSVGFIAEMFALEGLHGEVWQFLSPAPLEKAIVHHECVVPAVVAVYHPLGGLVELRALLPLDEVVEGDVVPAGPSQGVPLELIVEGRELFEGVTFASGDPLEVEVFLVSVSSDDRGLSPEPAL